eukprot:COSAG06_NODE_11278_length_1534_cov_1.241812_2_plen_130_part_00
MLCTKCAGILPRQAQVRKADDSAAEADRSSCVVCVFGLYRKSLNVTGAKNGIFFEFSLCLSRACLGKMIVYIYIYGSKMPFFAAISVLVSLVLWGSIWGLQGAVLSVPLLAAMKVALVRTQASNLPRGA